MYSSQQKDHPMNTSFLDHTWSMGEAIDPLSPARPVPNAVPSVNPHDVGSLKRFVVNSSVPTRSVLRQHTAKPVEIYLDLAQDEAAKIAQAHLDGGYISTGDYRQVKDSIVTYLCFLYLNCKLIAMGVPKLEMESPYV